MALTKCPECGGMVSNAAAMCVHCGYPIGAAKQLPADVQQQDVKEMLTAPVVISIPERGDRYGKEQFLLIRDDGGESLAEVRWGEELTVELDKPAKLRVRTEKAPGPAEGIIHLLSAQAFQIVALWMGLYAGLIFLLLSLIGVVIGISSLCCCGHRTLIAFEALPDKRYRLYWKNNRKMQYEEIS